MPNHWSSLAEQRWMVSPLAHHWGGRDQARPSSISVGSQMGKADVTAALCDWCYARRWTKCASLVAPAGKLHDAQNPPVRPSTLDVLT